MTPVVIKVGGSLLDWAGLPGAVSAFLDRSGDDGRRLRARAVLVAGGGPFADAVRSMDRTHGLDDASAHRLAILGMDLSAALLAAIVPGLAPASDPRELSACRGRGCVPVVVASRFLAAADDGRPDRLPASWDVTSDSIAARVAEIVGASRLILLKSAATPEGIDRDEAARLGLVDRMFPAISRGIPAVELICLRDPAAIMRRLS